MRALFSAHPADGHALPAPGAKATKDTPMTALPGSSEAKPAAIYSTGRWAADFSHFNSIRSESYL